MTITPKQIQKEFTPANTDTAPPSAKYGAPRYVATNGCFNAATTDIVRVPAQNR